jgi:hypothetical protein
MRDGRAEPEADLCPRAGLQGIYLTLHIHMELTGQDCRLEGRTQHI